MRKNRPPKYTHLRQRLCLSPPKSPLFSVQSRGEGATCRTGGSSLAKKAIAAKRLAVRGQGARIDETDVSLFQDIISARGDYKSSSATKMCPQRHKMKRGTHTHTHILFCPSTFLSLRARARARACVRACVCACVRACVRACVLEGVLRVFTYADT